MKRLQAVCLTCLLLAAALCACAEQEQRAAILSCGAGAPAVSVLAAQTQGLVAATAQSDRAALEQLSSGACQFAVVREDSLRDALTGAGEYYGQALDNLVRLDNLLLGAFCVFSCVGEADVWPENVSVLVLQDGGAGEELSAQVTQALATSNVRVCSREEALQAVRNGEAQVIMGLMLPGEELLLELCQRSAVLVSPALDMTAPVLERSMTRSLLPVLYDGMPYTETFCLYGALVTAKEVDGETQQNALQASSSMQAHVHNLPPLPVDGE